MLYFQRFGLVRLERCLTSPVILTSISETIVYVMQNGEKNDFVFQKLQSYYKIFFYNGLFFGLVISMILYNFFIFSVTKNKAYLFYIFYVHCQNRITRINEKVRASFLYKKK